MKKLLLSTLIGTALFANIANAQTYFECTDILGSQFRLTDSEKSNDFLTYQAMYHNGESEQFDLPKSNINFIADNLQDDKSKNHYFQSAQFKSDKAHHEMYYHKFADGKEYAYVTAILFGEEDIDDKGFYHCNMTKPVIHSLDKLK